MRSCNQGNSVRAARYANQQKFYFVVFFGFICMEYRMCSHILILVCETEITLEIKAKNSVSFDHHHLPVSPAHHLYVYHSLTYSLVHTTTSHIYFVRDHLNSSKHTRAQYSSVSINVIHSLISSFHSCWFCFVWYLIHTYILFIIYMCLCKILRIPLLLYSTILYINYFNEFHLLP